MQKEHKVLIVDDHIFSSSGVSQLLLSTSKYEVLEDRIDNGLKVYAACGRTQPDIIILDLGLPGMDGIDIIHQIKKRWPETMIVVLTANTHEHRATEARKAGASGYVLKTSSQNALLATLEIVISGKICFDKNLNLSQIFDINNELILENQSLTTRERQTLKLIAKGNRNRDIAEKLKISIKTVETHRLNLMRKLNAHCIADLVNLATRIGLTSD